jgi:hemerythrin-like domain-containing protein
MDREPASPKLDQESSLHEMKGGRVNAIKLLKQDHQRIRKLFDDYDDARQGSARKRDVAESIFRELELHRRLEEEIFYPAVSAGGNEEVRELVIESLEEHQDAGALIEELRDMEPGGPGYEQTFAELMESVQEHIDAEESEMFPQAEKSLRDQLDEMGSRMEEQKELTSTH